MAAVVGIPRWHARGQKIEVEVSQESSGGRAPAFCEIVWLVRYRAV
jgi:hypothetical protein